MDIRKTRIRSLALGMLLLGATAISGCSTGTNDGDASVEKGGPKDKNPTEHNVEAQRQPNTDTTGNMDQPYEETDAANDKNVDGMADEPGTTSEHQDPQKQ
jgi:hypothetical protein